MARNAKYHKNWVRDRIDSEHQNRIDSEYRETKWINKLNNAQVLDNIFNGKIGRKNSFYNSNIKYWEIIIGNHLSNIRNKDKKTEENYREVCLDIVKKSSKFFDDEDNVKSLKHIAYYKENFINEINTWRPTGKRSLLHDILRHLFVKYETPKFLDKSFINGNIEAIEFFLHIGNGKSARSFIFKPELELNKKSYQFLQSTPKEFTYFEAFRRAQVLSIGGNELISNAILSSKLGRNLNGEKFWYTVIQLFVQAGMFDVNKIPEIIDFIHNRKYERTIRMVNGFRQYADPEQPGLTMKGRTIETLLTQSDRWHAHLSKIKHVNITRWDGFKISDWTKTIGKDKNKIRYDIVQLLTSKELTQEGRELGHCVSSYASSCFHGNCAIFSFRNQTVSNFSKSLLTIEVKGTQIVQMRGKNNRKYTNHEVRLVEIWAKQEGLSFSRWI